jgi:Na+-driven multidrug efflux pump
VKENYFTRKIFYRFFMPSLFSTFCLAVANLADALCVGIRMGEPALAAISLVSPIYMVFNVMDIGIAVGGSVIYARRMGEGNAAGAQKAFSQMIFLALLLSGSVAVLGMVFLEPLLLILGASPAQGAVYQMTKDYAVRLLLGAPTFFFHFLFYYFIRCDDGEKRASVGFAAANLLDVGLSFVLVLFFDAGVKGGKLVVRELGANADAVAFTLCKARQVECERTRSEHEAQLRLFATLHGT